MKMKKTPLNKTLALSFLIVILGSIIISSIISNYSINKEFNNYLIGEQNDKIQNVISILQDSYTKNNAIGINIDELNRYAELQELSIEVRDLNNKIIYSSGNSHFGRRDNMRRMMNSMPKRSTMMDSKKYTEKDYTLKANGGTIGYVTIGYFDTSYLSSGSINFISTLNRSFIFSAIIALAFGLIISIIISKQISKPLMKITEVTNKMRSGNLEIRCGENSKTKEIYDLSASVNYLAETLRNQEMLRKRLTADMAHELRTPLTTLKTHIEAFLDGIWEPTKERLQVFYEEIQRLTHMVDNLYNLSKLEELNLNLNLSKINISEETKKIINTFKPIYQKENYELKSNIEQNLYTLIDRDKFKQIIYNLLSNALKYLNPQGTVELTLIKQGTNLMLTIRDSGIGISKEELPFIFERFFRSDTSRNKNTGGSGLGLTITKSFVEAHGGKISVDSTLGQGTTFEILLPLRME